MTMFRSNKRIGTEFEHEFCDRLQALGYWVHFLAPDARGAQPFDVIAVKDGHAIAVDCKTCASHTFSIKRLEDNQITAFELWMRRGNSEPIVAVKHEGLIYRIPYKMLKEFHGIRLAEVFLWHDVNAVELSQQ